MSKLIPTIGVEVHIELLSNAKVFSLSENGYGGRPNSKVNLFDLGYPGTLPVINKKIVEQGLKIALALNCKLNKTMTFDRKIYFYPDLSKGYQLTQRLTPIGYDGYIEIDVEGVRKKINIEEMHIEEDTAKSIHEKERSLLNYNRAGVPLVEIVSKPDIKSDKEAVSYLESLRLIMLYLGVSDVKIEEGSMRCDANISLKEEGSNVFGTKVEVKNIGSISDVGNTILYEIKRQEEIINNGSKVISETRRWDAKTNTTIAMRTKNTEQSYLFFPEPDIPTVIVDDDWCDLVKKDMPLLPSELKAKYKEYNISDITIKTIIQNKNVCLFFEEVIKENIEKTNAANILTSEVMSYLNKENLDINQTKLDVNNYIKLLLNIENGNISSKQAKEVILVMLKEGTDVDKIIKDSNMMQLNDDDELIKIINEVLYDNIDAINDYFDGKDRAIKHLMGQIMKKTQGSANPAKANSILIEELNRKR